MAKKPSILIERHKQQFEESVRTVRRVMHERSIDPDAGPEAPYQGDLAEFIIEGMRFNDRVIIADAEGKHVDLAAAAAALSSSIATVVGDFVKNARLGNAKDEKAGQVAGAEEIFTIALAGVKDMILETNEAGGTTVFIDGKGQATVKEHGNG
jgi:hypothetical protein